MNLKNRAVVFGIVFLLIGILGFVPAATPDNHLLGIFHVNLRHNVIHLASGAVALICGMMSGETSKRYFQIFGIVYALVAVVGFFNIDGPLLGYVAHNMADLILHIVIAVAALFLGFSNREMRQM